MITAVLPALKGGGEIRCFFSARPRSAPRPELACIKHVWHTGFLEDVQCFVFRSKERSFAHVLYSICKFIVKTGLPHCLRFPYFHGFPLQLR